LVDGVAWIDALGREAIDQVPPYRFEDVHFELEGPHALTLEAVDHFGNTSTASAMIFVGEPSSDESGETSGETDSETGERGETSGEAPADTSDAAACSCTSDRPRDAGDRPRDAGALALLLLSALGLRSRRRPRAANHSRH
jgi:hypothetical protein